MVKVKDYTPDGEILAEGTPVGCIGCHEGMDDNDYIIVRPIDLEL